MYVCVCVCVCACVRAWAFMFSCISTCMCLCPCMHVVSHNQTTFFLLYWDCPNLKEKVVWLCETNVHVLVLFSKIINKSFLSMLCSSVICRTKANAIIIPYHRWQKGGARGAEILKVGYIGLTFYHRISLVD